MVIRSGEISKFSKLEPEIDDFDPETSHFGHLRCLFGQSQKGGAEQVCFDYLLLR